MWENRKETRLLGGQAEKVCVGFGRTEFRVCLRSRNEGDSQEEMASPAHHGSPLCACDLPAYVHLTLPQFLGLL